MEGHWECNTHMGDTDFVRHCRLKLLDTEGLKLIDTEGLKLLDTKGQKLLDTEGMKLLDNMSQFV